MIRFAALLFTALLAGPALADQTPPAAPAADPSADVRYAPVTHHTFTGEEVDGRTQRPDGDVVLSRHAAPLGSLIRIRTDFDRELLQSAQDL